MPPKHDYTAKHILALLEGKHGSEVFIPECKDGPSAESSHRRLDAWVFKKTWSPVTTIGYEIKVARNDFLRDDKWPDYLDLCHQFYFVCPKGLIAPEEIPPEAGLLYATGKRLYTKKKAPHRVLIDNDRLMVLLFYVLMCRTQVTPSDRQPMARGLAYWEAWLADKEHRRKVGYTVRGEIATAYNEARRAEQEAKNRLGRYTHLEKRLEELEVANDQYLSDWAIDRALKSKLGPIDEKTERVLQEGLREARVALNKVERALTR